MYTHTWKSEVKDSELDSLGIVHNSNYFIYCEHARHLYAKSLGLPFSGLLASGYSMIITKSEMAYKNSLVADDEFIVETQFTVKRIRLLMDQKITRPSDGALILKAIFHGTGIDNGTGKICLPPDLVKNIESANNSHNSVSTT
jgi:acyl-CoA thioester hydrolase